MTHRRAHHPHNRVDKTLACLRLGGRDGRRGSARGAGDADSRDGTQEKARVVPGDSRRPVGDDVFGGRCGSPLSTRAGCRLQPWLNDDVVLTDSR
jgi:hypothetical protein